MRANGRIKVSPPPIEQTEPFEIHRYDPETGEYSVEQARWLPEQGVVFGLEWWEEA